MADMAVTDDQEVDQSRRRFLTAATVATGAVGAAFAITPFIKSWNPSERARALGAPTEVDVSKIEPGQMVVTSWRKQAIYVVHRTPEMVAALPQNDARLKDPASADSEQPDYAKNEMRSAKADYLVLIGICTHLGCLPKQHFERGDAALGADWPGGFFCPCHGSNFDLAGRVYKSMPAPTNLEIPPHQYLSDTSILVGEDGKA